MAVFHGHAPHFWRFSIALIFSLAKAVARTCAVRLRLRGTVSLRFGEARAALGAGAGNLTYMISSLFTDSYRCAESLLQHINPTSDPAPTLHML